MRASSLERLPVDVEDLAAEVKAHGPVRPPHDARVRLPLGLALFVETDLPSKVKYILEVEIPNNEFLKYFNITGYLFIFDLNYI